MQIRSSRTCLIKVNIGTLKNSCDKNITRKQAYVIGKKLGIDFNKISVDAFRQGMQVELEHGTITPLTNVSNNALLITGKIRFERR